MIECSFGPSGEPRATLRSGSAGSTGPEAVRRRTGAPVNAVDLLLRMPESRAHTFSEYRSMLEAAAFEAGNRNGGEVIGVRRP